MKCLIHQDGSVELTKSEKITPEEGWCAFDVKACGICGSDIPRVFAGTSYYYPIVLGHEFAGVVRDSQDPDLIGKRACVFPILPCGECEFCKKEQWASCTHYDYYGSRRNGGLQSSLLMKESNLVFLPDNVSYEAGSMIEPMAVCLHAVKKATIDSKSMVLVYGAGTIGLLAGMWARAFGAKAVLFSDPDERRMRLAKDLNFDAYDGTPADVIIEASGAPAALNSSIENANAFATVVLVGHSGKDVTVEHQSFSKLLRKQLTLVGSWNSDFRADVNDWKECVEAIAQGRIDPEPLITHKIPLENADRAFAIIGGRQEFYNKITVVM